jgi:hypothetical protein
MRLSCDHTVAGRLTGLMEEGDKVSPTAVINYPLTLSVVQSSDSKRRESKSQGWATTPVLNGRAEISGR